MRFARAALDLLQWMIISAVAQFLGVDWDLIKELHKEHLEHRYKERLYVVELGSSGP